MEFTTSFHMIWDRIEPFKPEELIPDEQVFWCGYAREFYEWLQRWVLNETDYNLVGLNQAKLIVLDKYLEFRSFVPKAHQERINEHGHVCIYHIFIRACEQLKITELRLQKPMLFIPEPPPPAPRFEPKGPILFLGSEGD